MRFLGATALVLAIITECFGAHSDRSRQRSGPIRSVPVAADIKRDNDFDCPEEFGYYPHPSDCTLYYVCVFGGALQESCTGGLMYSHELQTCDWPRNVGCDGVSSAGGDELERISEREPPQRSPPRRAPNPPPQRVQPNPVITSRGQPKFNRDEYEKQQQLYAEVDDLPPVEEIESDRQQRVYRGQPSTIGQVQKDRDGYSQVNSGRTFNSNIIPASIPQNNGKIGSFSFGTQIDERRNDERRIDERRNEDRRTATVTPAPQTYSENKHDNVTDSQHDRQFDIETNVITVSEVIEKPVLRLKRDVVGTEVGLDRVNTSSGDYISKRNDEEMEYVEFGTEAVPAYGDERGLDDTERGKRQIRYFLKNGFKTPGKNWGVPKQVQLVDLRQHDYNPTIQNVRHQSNYNGYINNNLPEVTQKPSLDLGSVDSYQLYQSENLQSQRPFKPSLRDPTKQNLSHNPANIATQIITKSPPISALKHNENPFASLAGGFFNNAPRQISNLDNSQHSSLYSSFFEQPKHVVFPDASHLPSTIVTGKTILLSTSPRTPNRYKTNEDHQKNSESSQNVNDHESTIRSHQKPDNNEASEQDDESNEDDDESSENHSSEKEETKSNEHFKHDFPEPPYEFTHPINRFRDIENPFANPNFDFDAFLTKLTGGQYTASPQQQHTSPRPTKNYNSGLKAISPSVEITTSSSHISGIRSSTLNYKGMSTPRPFNGADDVSFTVAPNHSHQNFHSAMKQNIVAEQWTQRPHNHRQNIGQEQQQSLSQNVYQVPQQNAGIPLDIVRPKLKPPNFKDDRQLPISYSFNRPLENNARPNQNNNPSNVRIEKPQTYVVLTGTSSPQLLSTPKQQYLLKHLVSTGKPYLISSVKPHNTYIAYKQSTPKPLTTVANEQLAALQHFWGNSSPAPESYFSIQTSGRPSSAPKLENLYYQSTGPTPTKNKQYFSTTLKDHPSTTTRFPPKRRPIPKPSPEMNDYYYDEDEEDEQYYFEPPVKSQYMPSSEVKPQRPLMAQNYKEYDDSYEEDGDQPVVNIRPQQSSRRPTKFTTRKPETVTKNYNDVSVVTKGSIKDLNKHVNGKIPVPVLVNYVTPASPVLVRPDVSNYEIIHHAPRNRTMHIKKPVQSENGPHTLRPPKYLNQTTLRPYTVRHRLAKPTVSNQPLLQNEDSKLMRGRQRHQNIVVQMKHTTPRDSHNQETRYTKTKHDDKTNSLEPTENVAPVSYSASPRPKMLYNGSQNYNPDQYDPYYAVYDEDGELYKDTDYVQHYNTASLRPAVQQTYRGTPPPQRRPVETYTPRPVSVDDYDDELIQGQINNQNQYQSPIRHSTRGDGNELGYEHNPSSVKTTIYEATSISTTPPTTTSTTTTTQRSTTAPFTEAMTPSRYTARSSTDENPIQTPKPSLRHDPSDGLSELDQSSPSPVINLSVLAKPFEKTDNSHRLSETLLSTERTPTFRQSSRITNKESLDVLQPSNEENKKVVSLTSGFSIRRNPNNTNNQYTLTVLTRPFDDYNKSRRGNIPDSIKNRPAQPIKYYHYDSDDNRESVNSKIDTSQANYDPSSEVLIERKDSSEELQNEDDIPVYTRPKIRRPTTKQRLIVSTEPTTTSTTTAPKFYLKTIVRRPSPVSSNSGSYLDSTENSINTEAFVNIGTENIKLDMPLVVEPNTSSKPVELQGQHYDKSEEIWDDAVVSPYKSLDNLRSSLNNNDNLIQESTTSSTSTTQFSSSLRNLRTERPQSKPSYFSYRVVDDFVPDQTTEVFSGKVKNVLRAFFTNIASTPTPRLLDEFSITTVKTPPQPEEKVVNIGFQKKTLKYVDEKPLRNNFKRLQIITEPSVNRFIPSSDDVLSVTESDFVNDFSSTSTSAGALLFITDKPTTPVMIESSATNEYRNVPNRKLIESKFDRLTSSKSEVETSRKFHNLLHNPSTDRYKYESVSYTNAEDITTKTLNVDTQKTPTEIEWNRPTNTVLSEIASTTSTTKATSTVRIEPTSSTKSISFPTRASRVNPAIKLAATNPGGGRRSYQTSSKCSSDNSLQANPKCNEIKYQRPSSMRGRGHAHYSTGSDAPPIPNRGTPPTRSRPTLKPSTAIVTKTTEFVDIYNIPPGRPAPVYPQPTPDKTAAKCRKDVCLLPDCSCGGRDIPGEMPVETVPQIVLLTFDDSVNDLNKALYADLFEKGRVNPNGCPISATFYVSHEWTDYSQVQNLYAAGHEMASHTVSHSFGEQFSQKKWNREVGGQREILAAYGGVKLEDVRGMRAPFLSVGGNKMFKMLYDSNFTYDSSMPVYENRPPSWPYTLDYKLFHDCMIPPCPTKSYPGVWEVPMVMWQDLNGGRCSMGDACANPPDAEGVYKMILKNFDRHYTTNRAPFGLYYHAAWFTQPHHKAGFIMFLDFINQMSDVWILTNWQALQWVRDPTPISRINNFQPFQCNYQDRPKKCNNPKVCNLWHKSGVRYMRTCQPCPEVYPWTGKTGIKSSRIDNDIGE